MCHSVHIKQIQTVYMRFVVYYQYFDIRLQNGNNEISMVFFFVLILIYKFSLLLWFKLISSFFCLIRLVCTYIAYFIFLFH